MSPVTRKELTKLREDNPTLSYTVESLKAIKNMLLDEVDRLSARCEELKKERDDYFRIIEERGAQITGLCDNLSSLLSAVEPIVKQNLDKPMYADPVSGYLCLKIDWWYKFQEDLRTLSTVAAGIRGGLGNDKT